MERHYRALRPHRLENLVEYSALNECPRFWADTHGLRGLRERASDAGRIALILENGVLAGLVSPEDAVEAHALALRQLAASALGLFHVERAARHALALHWQLTARARTLLQVEGAPDCMLSCSAFL